VTTGGDALFQSANPDELFILSRATGTLSAVDPQTLELYDIAESPGVDDYEDFVIADGWAWITRRSSPRLTRIDLATGATSTSTDLSAFADDDGNPELGTMVAHEGRLYVQVRRFNELAPSGQAAPAYIAIVDVATGALIDTDPMMSGVQAIALEGTAPKHRMQIVPGHNQLAVSASGTLFDEGGLELIDLDALESLGLQLRESDGAIGADLGPVVMTGSERGFLEFSTDFDLSSHLVQFRLGSQPQVGPQLFVSVGYAVPTMGHASHQDVIFVPDGGSLVEGFNVFDSDTGDRLTAETVALDGRPTDLLVLCC
jgi:hypothetical protein